MEGTADLQHHLHLRMGDVLIFAQKEDTTIVLAGRPPTKADALKKPAMRKASPSPLGRPAGGRRDAVSAQQWMKQLHGLVKSQACAVSLLCCALHCRVDVGSSC